MGILRRPVLLGLFLLVLMGSQTAFGYAVPHYMNVQGVLRNVAGDLVTGTYQVFFKVYDAETAGNLIWSSGATPLSVQVSTGVFNVYLGEFTTNIFAPNATRWLEIQVSGDTALARKQITAVGYAFTAERAVTADSVTSAAPDVSCTGCVTSTEVNFNYAGSVSKGGPASDVACEAAASGTGCIGSAEIVDGAIATADIGNAQVTSAKLASSIDISGSFTASTVLVKNSLYTGASATASTERLTNSGALRNITTLNMSGQLTNTVAAGTAPMVITSTTKVGNLNADLLDGNDTLFFTNASNLSNGIIPAARLPIAGGDLGAVKSGGAGISINATTGVISNTGVLSVTGTSPVVAGTASGAVTVSMPAATDSTSGYLTASDHATFAAFGSNKLSSVALKANDATYTDGSASLPFVGNGTAASPLGMYKASGTYSGWLHKTDWTAFNGKAPGSGSANYIQNQQSANQSANLRISGNAIVGNLVTGGSVTTAPVAEIQIGDPYTYVASNWGGSYRQGVMVAHDTDNVFFGIVDGAAADDSRGAIIFGDNTDDYFSFQRNDQNGAKSELMRILYGGTVGIGTTTPNTAYKLDVGGRVNASELCINGACQTSWATVTSLWGQTGTSLYPNATATNVVIGGTTANQKLTITGNSNVFGVDNGAYFQARNTGSGYENYLWPRATDNGMYMNYGSGGFHVRNNSSVDAMYMDASRNTTFYPGGNAVTVDGGVLNLSDAAGATKFTLRSYENATSLWLISNTSASNVLIGTGHNWDQQIGLKYTPGGAGANTGDLVIGQIQKNSAGWTHGYTRFINSGSERMRIHNNGYVGISKTDPAVNLHVGGPIASTSWVGAGCEGNCEGSGGYAILYPQGFGLFTKSAAVGGTAEPAAGNLYVANAIGVGTASPGYNVDVYGTGRFTGHLSANSIGSVGNITTCGGMLQTNSCPAPFNSKTAKIGHQALCMTAARSGGTTVGGYLGAQKDCFALGGHICTGSEIFMLADAYGTDTNGLGVTVGEWLGMRYSDGSAFYVNQNGSRAGTHGWYTASGFDFDGVASIWEHRNFHCCYAVTYNP